MNQKIMILSSDKTGQGHESIVQALKEQFSELYSQTEVKIVNGFIIGGSFGRFVERLYYPAVKYTPFLWKLFFQLTSRFPGAMDAITSRHIEKDFIKNFKEFNPDLIVSVHPGFVGSINNLLQKHRLDIPFIVLIADLVSLSSLWADPRSSCILCPTEESKARLMEFGLDEDKLKVFGFPVRKRFCKLVPDGCAGRDAAAGDTLNLLIFANAFGRIRTESMVEKLTENFNCSLTILTGRDERLRKYLDKRLKTTLGEKLRLPGYVVNMEQYMNDNDVLITKAGPNIIMEAIHSGIPVIMTGSLPGQEEDTPEWVVSQGMGAVSIKIPDLIETIRKLLANDKYLLKEIARNQRLYNNTNAAQEMVRFISAYETGPGQFSHLALSHSDSKVPAL